MNIHSMTGRKATYTYPAEKIFNEMFVFFG